MLKEAIRVKAFVFFVLLRGTHGEMVGNTLLGAAAGASSADHEKETQAGGGAHAPFFS